MKNNLAKGSRSRSAAPAVANSNVKLAVAAAPDALAPDHSRIISYLESNQPGTPCLVVDLSIVAGKYGDLRAALPAAEIFYAVKANPAPEILGRLVALGSSFDTASAGEIRQVLAAGATPSRIRWASISSPSIPRRSSRRSLPRRRALVCSAASWSRPRARSGRSIVS